MFHDQPWKKTRSRYQLRSSHNISYYGWLLSPIPSYQKQILWSPTSLLVIIPPYCCLLVLTTMELSPIPSHQITTSHQFKSATVVAAWSSSRSRHWPSAVLQIAWWLSACALASWMWVMSSWGGLGHIRILRFLVAGFTIYPLKFESFGKGSSCATKQLIGAEAILCDGWRWSYSASSTYSARTLKRHDGGWNLALGWCTDFGHGTWNHNTCGNGSSS